MNQNVYITAIGRHLPGALVTNDRMESRLGLLGGKSSRIKDRILRENGIRGRYYAIDEEQKTTLQNHEMAALAVKDALQRRGIDSEKINYLATATSQADLPLPGFASMVHSNLDIDAPEIASFQSICSTGLMALKGAFLQVRTGESNVAVACASEMPSRLFKASRFEAQKEYQESGRLPFESEFLRWMLSDGAGACILEDKPKEKGFSLKIDWIKTRTFANKYPVCMYVGGPEQNGKRDAKSWLDFDHYAEAADSGYINLRQDVRLLPELIKIGVDVFFDLLNQNLFKSEDVDYFLFHYSSEAFKQPIVDLFARAGLRLPEEKWFTNLHTKGNTGAASIYIMLEELFNERELKEGQKILCMVPESGRFNIGFMLLEVVGSSAEQFTVNYSDIQAPKLALKDGTVQERLVRDLTRVWIDFERELRNVPIIQRLYRNQLSVEDYQKLLRNIRAQVIDGSRWISRAASNLIDQRLLEIRSMFIQHAKEEHRHHQMLEQDFISTGGNEAEIINFPKNLGSEALSAWMFQRASRENPVDILGAMYIIEGLGNRVAYEWGERILEQLKLNENQVSFLLYHGKNDENHFDRLEKALNSDLLTTEVAAQIVKTAKVTARLYRLQIEEIDNI